MGINIYFQLFIQWCKEDPLSGFIVNLRFFFFKYIVHMGWSSLEYVHRRKKVEIQKRDEKRKAEIIHPIVINVHTVY